MAKFEDTHSTTPGKSIVEKIQDELDAAIREVDKEDIPENVWFAEGIAHALSIMRSTEAHIEIELSERRINGMANAESAHDPMHDRWRNR